MIPKILHQVWIGNKKMPKEFVIWRKNWRKLHPDWEYRLWDDEKIKEFEGINQYLERARGLSSKANVVRLFVVYKYGGVYADTDFDWNKSINEFLDNDAFAVKEVPSRYANSLFGATIKHHFLEWQIDKLNDYVDKDPPWGPYLFTHAMNEVGNNVSTLPTNFFYPYLWNEDAKPTEYYKDAYAVHHWGKSWQLTKLEIIKKRTKNFLKKIWGN
jgi:inositol phosphorylceramide mannosyltransferase catalytic subunit